MPTFNRSELLKIRIADYVAHMDDDMELHVRDNGSTDDTWNVLQSMPHARVNLARDPVDTHVKVGFLRVLYTAAEQSDYVVLMSDEDIPDWNILPDFKAWLTDNEPVFASTRFDHSEGFHRGRTGGHIPVTEFFRSSFYCSGLVYRSEELLEAIDVVWPRLDDNDFLKIYAEAGCVLAMYDKPGPKLWAPHFLCKQVDQLDTHIVMDDGSRYWKPDNRRKLSTSYQALCDDLHEKTGRDIYRQAKNETLIRSWG
jgi:glycosyltransferase involved in cell wall biosynthesis